jgi:hypothetical protein
MSEKIICRINDTPTIRVRFGEQGLKGDPGTSDHALLEHLDYSNAGHTGFQKKLTYVTEYKAYLVE